MSWFGKRDAAPKEKGPRAYSRTELRSIARDIAIHGWYAPMPEAGVTQLMVGELQRQIDDMKGEVE